LLLLQVHRRLTARELARRLEVSERTIQRDMEALSVAGVPVYAARGAGGGWALREAYRTDLTGLNEAEIQSLFLSPPARLLADLGLRQAAEGALAKVLAALPAGRQRGAEFARQRVYVDTSGWNRAAEDVPHLPALQEAVWQERKVALTYRRGDGAVVERLVDPLGLVAKGNAWYLVAAVEGEPRTYRVSRIREAVALDQPCAPRPADFDLAAYWERSAAQFQANIPRFPAVVRVDPAILPRARGGERYTRVAREDPPGPDGRVPLTILCEDEHTALEWALSFGPQVEVVEPAGLRAAVIAAAEGIVARYGVRAGVPRSNGV
jgi:predicted DNA-binding transcriptional regulator YafY